jgi:hypothetical protein
MCASGKAVVFTGTLKEQRLGGGAAYVCYEYRFWQTGNVTSSLLAL